MKGDKKQQRGCIQEEVVEKRHEEANMHGANERKAEAYFPYVEVLSEWQQSRLAQQ